LVQLIIKSFEKNWPDDPLKVYALP